MLKTSAAALRDNLKRRKAQHRARAEGAEKDDGEGAEPTTPPREG